MDRVKSDLETEQSARLREILWHESLKEFLDSACRTLLLATMTDHIAQSQDIDLKIYFAEDKLRATVARRIELLRAMYAHRLDPDHDDLKVAANISRRFGITLETEEWTAHKHLLKSQLACIADIQLHLIARGLKSDLNDCSTKAIMAHYLLKDVCENGIYYNRGMEHMRNMFSTFHVIDVVGYLGEPKAIESVLGVATEQAKARQVVEALRNVIRATRSRALVEVRVVPGAELLKESPLVRIRQCYQAESGAWRIILPYQQPTTAPNQQGPRDGAATRFAYDFAVADYAPSVKSGLDGWSPNVSTLAAIVSMPGVATFLPEFPNETFVNRTYSAASFQDAIQMREKIDTVMAKTASVRLGSDNKTVAVLRDEVERLMAAHNEIGKRGLAGLLPLLSTSSGNERGGE
ncbi:MAG: hypothetical protein ACRD39_02200 [Nitrososphaeraceae archaeon]